MTAPVYPVPKPSSAHSDLQRDLCRYLQRDAPRKFIPLKEMDLGLRIRDASVQRADVWALRWIDPIVIHIYEVKVSRSDFQSDINSGKWEGYINQCHWFFFVTPYGLVTKDEIPERAGWLEQRKSGKGFKVLNGIENPGFIPAGEMWAAVVKKQATYGG